MSEQSGIGQPGGPVDDAAVAAQVRAVREEYAEEEAEAAEVEAAQNGAALAVPLSLRITRELDAVLKERAATEQVSPSALVRRILRQVLHDEAVPVLTVEQVERIARRVMRESA